MAIVTWEYYCSRYNEIKEADFESAEALAEIEVKRIIGPRWETITPDTYGYDVLQDCICKVMNKLVFNKKAGIGKGIASASNDGYSQTFAITKAEEVEADIKTSIRNWLSGTGLVGAY